MRERMLDDSPTPPTVATVIVGVFVSFPIPSMHFPVYVIIGPDGCIDSEVGEALDPYWDDLDVAPYKEYLSNSECEAMAREFNIPATNLPALATRMRDWRHARGGIDDVGLFAWSRINPNGRWDWYVIGGRWDGYIHGKLTCEDAYSPALKDE